MSRYNRRLEKLEFIVAKEQASRARQKHERFSALLAENETPPFTLVFGAGQERGRASELYRRIQDRTRHRAAELAQIPELPADFEAGRDEQDRRSCWILSGDAELRAWIEELWTLVDPQTRDLRACLLDLGISC